jgi:hypothetical protein
MTKIFSQSSEQIKARGSPSSNRFKVNQADSRQIKVKKLASMLQGPAGGAESKAPFWTSRRAIHLNT